MALLAWLVVLLVKEEILVEKKHGCLRFGVYHTSVTNHVDQARYPRNRLHKPWIFRDQFFFLLENFLSPLASCSVAAAFKELRASPLAQSPRHLPSPPSVVLSLTISYHHGCY
jgi:hypothetical protein